MLNEEISMAMGLDTSEFRAGQQRVFRMMDGIKEKGAEMKEGLKSALEVFGAGIGVGMLAETGKKALEFAESIKRGAEIAGVSTEFYQTLGAAMREAGGDAAQAETGLAKLAALIGQSAMGNSEATQKFKDIGISVLDAAGHVKNTQQVWNELSDIIAGTTDATQQAAVAATVFGERLGPELVSALKMGSKGIEDFGKSVTKLSDDDIKSLHELHSELDQDAVAWQVWSGKVIRSIADASSSAGRGFAMFQEEIKKHGIFSAAWALATNSPHKDIADEFKPQPEKAKDALASGGLPKIIGDTKEYVAALKALQAAQDAARTAGMKPEEKLHELERESAEIQSQMDSIKGTAYERAHSVEMLKLEKELVEKNAKAEELRLQIAQKQKQEKEHELAMTHEITKAQESLNEAQSDLANTKADRSRLTIKELASSNLRFGGQLGEDQATARQITQLEQWAEWNRQHGFLDRSAEQFSAADELRKNLSSNVVDKDREPFKDAERNIKRQADAIDELVKKASNEGIKIIPSLTQ